MFKDTNFEKITFLSPKFSALKILRTHGYKNKDFVKKKILDSAEKALERLIIILPQLDTFTLKRSKKRHLIGLSLIGHLLIVRYLMRSF